MKFNKTIIVLALASTLSACGSDNSAPTIVPPPPVPVETTVTGQAIKGVLANAVVTVYKFVDGKPVALDPATELKGGEITTDGSGNYSFVVLDYEGPIKIELSPSTDPENPTTMTCDAPAGCGDTAFGNAIDLTAADPNFTLAAISVVDSESAGEVKVNVSALTHLAAELIEADEGGVTAETVTEKSTLIASTFGIEGDITQLEATVTTDAAAVAGEDNEDELRLGLINAGIMAAMFSGETDDAGVLSTKLAEVASDLIENDGALLVNQDEEMEGFELAISDVLEGAGDAAAAAVELIVADETLTGTEEILNDLAQEEVNLENEQAYQQANVGEGGFSEVVIDEPTEGDAVAKAKAMVNDVRLFTHLFDETTPNGAGIKTQGDEYLALMDAAGVMITTEADSFTLLAQISDALATITMKLDDGTIVSAAGGVDIATYLTPDEITGAKGNATGTITFDGNTATGGVLFSIDGIAGDEKVILNASAEFSDDKMSIVLNFDGLIESAGAKFTLSSGSFAKINLDSAASRATFDDDSYEGGIVSGELKLHVILAQKATSTGDNPVTNPITFTGMLHTKLLAVEKRVLDKHWTRNVWNVSGEQYIEGYGRPEFETFVLPETLSLSGTFSSLEADSISATLTVGINNLTGYEAADFKYIGKEVADVFAINVSEDKNTVVVTPSDILNNPFTLTSTFTPSENTSEWTNVSSNIPADPETHPWGESLIATEMLRFDGDIITYSNAGVVEGNSKYRAWVTKFSPVDTSGDGVNNAVEVANIRSWDGQQYDSSALLDADGNLLLADGSVHSFDNAWVIGTFNSITAFVEHSGQSWAMPYDLDMISNAADLYAQQIDRVWGGEFSSMTSLGKVSVFFDKEELMALKDGSVMSWDGFITQALIKDALTIEVSEDTNSVTTILGNQSWVTTFAFTGEGSSLGDFSTLTIYTNEHKSVVNKVWSETENIEFDIPEVVVSINRKKIYHEDEQLENNFQFKITPIDTDGDGIADQLTVYRAKGDHFTVDGVLVYEDGVTEAEFNQNFGRYSYDSESDYTHITELLSFNPLTVNSALDILKGKIVNHWDSHVNGYVDDIGQVEVQLSPEDLDSIVANATTMFDGVNTKADSRNSFEDEETFLQGNAALTLEAILGDYQVKLQLSGERTALEAGAFDLDMSYRLPGADTQRSFTVHYNTEVEGRLTANNADGVFLVLNEPDEDATGTQILGHILVGPTLIVAATIEDRGNGLVVIVYSDETTDTL